MTPPILLVGEAYGEAEAKANAAFIGPSGAELLRQLAEAGIITLTVKPKTDPKWRVIGLKSVTLVPAERE